ncbi:MAG TPA: HD domain-containing protein [Anaeromyxobacter sp.]|nr:HD domain-containing protein [Anaeromyxobacter sp.]
MRDELLQAQAELAKALGRARAGEDRDLAQKVREAGEQVAHLLSGLLKLTRVHAPENHAFDAPVAEFGKALAALVELLGTVHVVTVEDQIYVNDVRIRSEGKAGSRDLGAELRRHDAGGLSFHAPLQDVGVRALVRALGAPAPDGEGKREALLAALQAAEVTTVEPAGVFRLRLEEGEDRRTPDEVIRRVLGLVAETWANLEQGRVLNPLPLRRGVLDLLDLGLGAPAFWGGFPAEAAPHAIHATEVAMVALLTARTAGFSTGFVQDLGIAALVHDTGYLTRGVGDGPAAFARHPLEGARVVLRQRGFHEAKVRRLRAILEHHRDHATPGARPTPGGAILRLAEDYVNVARLYGARVLRADALGAMVKASGTLYHPVLAQVLVNALGRHPPGTLLELDDGRFARVAAPARSPELWERPLVRAIDPRTRQLSPEIIDLANGPRIRRAVPG